MKNLKFSLILVSLLSLFVSNQVVSSDHSFNIEAIKNNPASVVSAIIGLGFVAKHWFDVIGNPAPFELQSFYKKLKLVGWAAYSKAVYDVCTNAEVPADSQQAFMHGLAFLTLAGMEYGPTLMKLYKKLSIKKVSVDNLGKDLANERCYICLSSIADEDSELKATDFLMIPCCKQLICKSCFDRKIKENIACDICKHDITEVKINSKH